MRVIGGILRFDGQDADIGCLTQMARVLTAPGQTPRLQQMTDGACGLFELDFAREPRQPELPDDRWMIAADVRLNRPDMFRAQYSGGSEAQALASVVERWGDDFPDKIDGDFALALWHRATRTLWLGRDFIGVRPLAYTYQAGRWFAFASAPKALHRTGLASCAPDPAALALLYYSNYLRGGDSGFAEIRYLTPGHSLRITGDTAVCEHRAWRPDPTLVGSWPHGAQAGAEELRYRVAEAVSARLPSHGRVATELSGGLDSSAITVLAARAMAARGGRILSLSQLDRPIAGIAADNDEPLVQAILQQEPNIEWRPFRGGESDRVDFCDEDIGLIGVARSVLAPQEAALETGADVILSGAGGDEGASYGPNAIISALFWQGRLGQVRDHLRMTARISGQSLFRCTANGIIRPSLPPLLRRAVNAAMRSPVPADPRRPFLNQEIRARANNWPYGTGTFGPDVRLARFVHSFLAGRCAVQAIRGMHSGVAYAFPLLDRRVVELSLSFPLHHLVADGLGRQPFRRAMIGILPEDVRLGRHKYTPYVGHLPNQARQKGPALATARALRDNRLAAAAFDVDAIIATLETVAEGDEVMALARHVADRGRAPTAILSQVSSAFRATQAAKHLVFLADEAKRRKDLESNALPWPAQS